jgi:hypothetical protein
VRVRLPVTVAAVALVAQFGCGGSSDDSAERAARARATERAALVSRLDRLQTKLHRRRALLRAERRRAARQAKRKRRQVSRGGDTATSSFDQVAAGLDGEVGAVIGQPRSSDAASFGSLQSGAAWSTSKVPIALRVLADAGGPSGLSSVQAEEMRNALTLSDNEAAAALFGGLERTHGGLGEASTAVEEILREGGDEATRISTEGRGEFSTYGQTEWSLVNQQRFMSSLARGCVVGQKSADYVLDLMGEVSSDTWGLGSAGLPARWKGGWGPGSDGRYLVRQMGILYVGNKEAIVTLAARPANGQFATGESMATAVARWLARQAPKYAAPPPWMLTPDRC